MPENVTIFYLEMNSPEELRPSLTKTELDIRECMVRQHRYNRFLYQFIGEKWLWTDKLSWGDDQWRQYVANDNLRTWVAYDHGAIAGYFELQRVKNDVEIIYFGLAEDFIGKGLGGHMLTEAIKKAWSWQGTRRVLVHTCTLDHPSALKNYQSRGMTIYREETE